MTFWSDPIWKGMRIVSLASASITLITLIVFVSGVHSWRIELITAVVTNFCVFAALVIRTLILKSKTRHTPDS